MAKPKKKGKISIPSNSIKGTPATTEGKRNTIKDKECANKLSEESGRICRGGDGSLLIERTDTQEEDSSIPSIRTENGCKVRYPSLGTNSEMVAQYENFEKNSDWSHIFESLLQVPPDIVVMKLREGISTKFLEKDNCTSEQLVKFINTVSLASKSFLYKESLCDLFEEVFSRRFSKKLTNIILQMRARRDLSISFFMDLVTVMEKFMIIGPALAAKMLPDLVNCCIVMLGTLNKPDGSSEWETLNKRFVQVLEEIDKKNLKWFDKKLSSSSNKSFTGESNDSFRNLSVMPKGDDISGLTKPLVRKNITKGKFENGDHYLDIQFRLLREDFVRPLRAGVREHRESTPRKSRDVRIYKDVKIIRSQFKQAELLHYIQLSLPLNFRVENTKRLMYGNLLCFSSDNFQNIICASIMDTDRDNLRRGQLGVKFENDINLLKSDALYDVVETRAYFEAYKHTLAALKEIDGSMIPFHEHIVSVESQVKAPGYLSPRTTYDLSVVKGKRSSSHLKDVVVRGKEWPSPEELGLDESQHKALRSALTHELAIIQGPPGTGKTFIGLKIAQVLLTNRHWQDQSKSPILCVCYTNHALDQFLEGMLSFSKNIVRVGSRSKSEKLERFQISTLCRKRRSYFEKLYYGKRADVRHYESCLNACQNGLNMCTDLKGIVSLDVLAEVIPWHIEAQLGNNLSDWLLNGFDFSLQPQEFQSESNNSDGLDSSHSNMEENMEPDSWEVVSQTEEEEEERQIWLEDEHYELPKEKPVVTYEVCEEFLQERFQELETVVQNNPSDADAFWSLVVIRNKLRVLRHGLKVKTIDLSTDIKETVNIWALDFVTRWSLYHLWIKKLCAKIVATKKQYEIILQSRNGVLKEINDARYMDVMREADVVGMTLTGAAKFRHLLQALAPAIVIVEEAAEILEAHVMAAVSPSCQHLIMIGDHQQLRPNTTVFELATKYGLDTSLFERMINNDVHYETLASQHRMRPTISQLLVPSIYPSLQDHSSVCDYPDIMGLNKNVFFVTHQYPEETPSDDDSRENRHEGEFIMTLCRYLLLQGYSPTDVTILTPYTGQFFLLRKLQRDHRECGRVRICIVDAFQGEENNIILLSLVRSNKEGNVGFLRINNRVCVALSRAKHGLYIIGNMKILRSSSNLWKTVEEKLKISGSIGNSLTLKCENHPHNLRKVRTAVDFFTEAPGGGCRMPCFTLLPSCGHPCPEYCHLRDRDHKNIMCFMKCERVCERNHPCSDPCWMKCACKVLVEKQLPCGHVHPVPCSVKESDFHCPTIVERVLPVCQHIEQMSCSGNPSMIVCTTLCNARLACGHQCTLACHPNRDPDHRTYKCRQPCERQPRRCILDHKCPRYCYEECGMCEVSVMKTLQCGHEGRLPCHLPEGCFVCEKPRDAVLPCGHEQVIKCFQLEMDVDCTTPCTRSLPCGHEQKTVCHLLKTEAVCKDPCTKTLQCGHRCQRKCFEPCLPCRVRVNKTINSCGHQVCIECCVKPSRKHCRSRCEAQLACGHQCQNYCNDLCTANCMENVASQCVRGHLFFLPCYISSSVSAEEAGTYCNEPCRARLECRHTCTGTCSMCFHGQVHIPCTQKCHGQLLCGHRCDRDCSSTCLPCQKTISFKCPHFTEKVPCGTPRKPCNKPCTWKCEHHKCKNKCSSECSRPACEEPCPEVLPCKHPCIGFCGDPCPTLCRFCNRDELNVRSKNIEKARFVLLEDCGHVIEVGRLEKWLNSNKDHVGVKICPQCRYPIYSNRRYYHIVSSRYEETRLLRKKYTNPTVAKKEVQTIVEKVLRKGLFREHLMEISKATDALSYRRPEMQKDIDKHYTLLFQANLLFKACAVHSAVNFSLLCLKYLERLIVHAMMQYIVSQQYIHEMTCELQRLCYLGFYHKSFINHNSEVVQEIEDILHCYLRFERFDIEMEERLQKLMNYTSSIRLNSHAGFSFRYGIWLHCPEGHPYCRQPYGRDHRGCNMRTHKVIPECQHKIYLECNVQPTREKCTAKCILKLACGHSCQARCCDECTSQCSERVVHPQKCPRGHEVVIPCSFSQTAVEEILWQSCESVCGEILPCGHSCGGQCRQCYLSGTHTLCREPCTKELPCGHRCQDKCYERCGRCRKRCMKRCKHKRCSNVCGAKCDPCLNPCSWRCKHHQCKNLCGEICSWPPCEEPCPKKLKCGHSCIGFCGDPCPKLCRICNKDDLLEVLAISLKVLQGSSSEELQGLASHNHEGVLDATSGEQQNLPKESIDNARFVLLEDCEHTVKVKILENKLEHSKRKFRIQTCPICQYPVYNNLLYQRLIAQ